MSRARKAGHRERAAQARWEPPPLAGRIAVGFAVALLLVAPPASNSFWAVNGLRSLPLAGAVGVIVAAVAAVAWMRARPRSWIAWAALAVTIAAMLAVPLREKLHFLGDTAVRIRAMGVFGQGLASSSIEEWSHTLHANPLDILVNFLGPIGLQKTGASVLQGIQTAAFLLALLYLWGAWRLAGVVSRPDARERAAVALALVLSGTLQAFAGYAESTGLLLVTAAWWWAEMLRPMAKPRDATRVAVSWFVMFLAHRMALVMLVPMAWRALGTPFPGDRPEPRGRLLIGVGLATAAAAVTLGLGMGGRQAQSDLNDMWSAFRAVAGGAWLPPTDVLNALFLVAPLAFLAPALAGASTTRQALATPEGRLLSIAALLLLPLAWVIPGGPNGLGAHRDWDLDALLGLTLTVLALRSWVLLSPARAAGALIWAAPAIAIVAAGWIGVNAHAPTALSRVEALPQGSPRMADGHLSHVYVFLGQRAMNQRQPGHAAPLYERAFQLNPNPRSLLLAAESWVLSGDIRRARSAVARARAIELHPSLREIARSLDGMIARATADSIARSAVRSTADSSVVTRFAR